MKDAIVEFEVMNWEKYNPRTDAKHCTWFRLDAAIFENPDVSRLSPSGFKLYIYMLSKALRMRGVGRDLLTRLTRECSIRSRATLEQYLDELQAAGIIKYQLRLHSNPRPLRNETNETNETKRTLSSEVETSLALAETKPKKPKPQKAPDEFKPAYQVWLAYVQAHVARYGTEPDKNAKVMNQCRMLVERVGLENAKELVGFYLQHNDSWYVKKVHVIECCLKDAEGLMTQMRANFKVTNAFAQQQDRSQSNLQVFEELAAKLSREGTSG